MKREMGLDLRATPNKDRDGFRLSHERIHPGFDLRVTPNKERDGLRLSHERIPPFLS